MKLYSKKITRTKPKVFQELGKRKLMLLAGLFISFTTLACTSPNQGKNESRLTNGDTTTSSPNNISDSQITEAIEWEFVTQDGVDAHHVLVETQEGIVTLSGTTNNILEKDRATEIARMMRGVRGVINRIQVEPEVTDDQLIRRNIVNALFHDPATESYEIAVEVNNGEVTLSGLVESWQEKQLAQKVAKGVNGVKSVDNEIAFRFVENRSDIDIKNDIQESMKWNVIIDDALIDVDVVDGNVSLTGTVGSASEHSEAEVSAWVAGVKSVDVEDLTVKNWAKDEAMREQEFVEKSDSDIKDAIVDAFLYDPRVYSFEPEVKVDDGRVTLSGTVNNLKAKQAAEMVANNIVGVWKVDNRLKVKFIDPVDDERVEANLKNRLSSDPYLDNYDIGVDVTGGVVFLTGEVNNYFEKYHTENLVSSNSGVLAIVNNLIVTSIASPYAFDFDYSYYYPFTRDIGFSSGLRLRDIEVKDNIEKQLWWSPFVDEEEIEVTVNNGVATLTGSVDSWLEYDKAEQNAFDGGAFSVDNNLKVTM